MSGRYSIISSNIVVLYALITNYRVLFQVVDFYLQKKGENYPVMKLR